VTTTADAPGARHTSHPASDGQVFTIETPFGQPVQWAEVSMVTDIGDHPLNDDRCLVITCTDLSERAPEPWRDFMLCLLADGASDSTFGPAAPSFAGERGRQAGWRASQLAQAAFVESFLSGLDPGQDVQKRLKVALCAADAALCEAHEGSLQTTLVALFLGANGTAYGASIGDSVLLVFPPKRKTRDDHTLKKLGYYDSTAVGSGDTADAEGQAQAIEYWYPNPESGETTVARGTFLVLLSDGVSDNLSSEAIEKLLHRHTLERATAALTVDTRVGRATIQHRSGASTRELGLDNMSAIVVRYGGYRGAGRKLSERIEDATLYTVQGTHGGPRADAGGRFAMVCLASQSRRATAVPAVLRHFMETEHPLETAPDQPLDVPSRLARAYLDARPGRGQTRMAVLVVDEQGAHHVLANDGARIAAAG
jgi:serine/threonine protein phosphatase PrpC